MGQARTIWTGNEHIDIDWTKVQVGDSAGFASPEAKVCAAVLGPARWFVLNVGPHQEDAVAERLTDAGFRARSLKVWRMEPSGQRDRYGNRQRIERERPMFPSYVFCDLRPGHHDFNKARSVKGAIDFLRSTDRWPCTITNDEVVRLELLESAEREKFEEETGPNRRRRTDVKVGDKITLVAGPFAGFVGQVAELDDDGRVQLLISLLGRETPMWIREHAELEKV